MPIRYAIPCLLLPLCIACSKDQPLASSEAGPTASASSAVPSATTVASAAPSASAAPEVQHDCPAGSTGLGSFSKPCDAKGNARMLEVAWNGKYADNGAPWFKVKSKSQKAILYARVGVYFYDKAGKQIDIKEAPEGSDKTHAYHTCSGKLFDGIINAGEKATYTFSCMGKSNIPDGTAAIEAEAMMVGFADASQKKDEFFWRNNDLTPEQRPKGGVK